MNMKKDDISRIKAALGAERAVALDTEQAQGPLDLLHMRADLAKRLSSSGGRPTDPSWTVRRVVPFRQEGWNQLESMARSCSEAGRKVSPSQLAAWLIEHGLSQLKKSKAV